VTGGSAKANANFGPGLYEMEYMSLGPANNEVLHDWRIAGKMKEAGWLPTSPSPFPKYPFPTEKPIRILDPCNVQ
jgi:hypothetical protein